MQSKELSSLLQHHSSKASILRCSAFFTVQLSHPYMTTGKSIALTRRTFVGKVMSLLLNMLSRLVITFFPRSKHLLISWLQSLSAVILELKKIKSDSVSTVSPSQWLPMLALRVNPNINDGFQLTIMYQYWLIKNNKYTSLRQAVRKMGSYGCSRMREYMRTL